MPSSATAARVDWLLPAMTAPPAAAVPTAPALTPQEVGDTKELTFDTALTMIVDGESGELGRQTVTETATITVEKTQASIETELTATGEIEIITKAPA